MGCGVWGVGCEVGVMCVPCELWIQLFSLFLYIYKLYLPVNSLKQMSALQFNKKKIQTFYHNTFERVKIALCVAKVRSKQRI